MHIFFQQLVNGLINGSIYVLFASGISLTFGVMRVVNFAHGEVSMLGGYAIYELGTSAGLGFWPGAVLAIAISAAIGVALNRWIVQPTLKVSGLNVMLTTLAVSLVMVNGTQAAAGTNAVALETPFTRTLHIAGLNVPESWPVVLGGMVVAMVLLSLYLTRTTSGKKARATGDNVLGARVVGIDTMRVYDVTFAIGAVLAGIAGIAFLMTADGDPTFGQPLLLIGFATVIVAGMGSIRGAAIVGMWFGVTGALFTQYVSTYYVDAYIYALMVVVLLLRPNGLFGASNANPLRAA